MKIQLTMDEKGLSVWPENVILRFDGQQWVDEDCDVRGTNGSKDWETFLRLIGEEYSPDEGLIGKRYILTISEITKGNK